MRVFLIGADLYLVGLGLTVAIVVYPAFHLVGAGQWLAYHDAHVRRISAAVAPAWAIQGVGSLWWLLHGPHRLLALAHVALAALAVVLTMFQALPIHHRLSRHHDDQDITQLERWHILRTVLWIGCATIVMLAR